MASPASSPPLAVSAGDRGFHSLRVKRVVRETADASSFVLDVPAHLDEVFTYEPGQFCNFRVQLDGETYIRSYSMSSSPAVDDELQVTVKRVPQGVVSNWMNDQLAEGDAIEVGRPTGLFGRGSTGRELVAFAGGSGITPVFSLLKTALATSRRTVRLLYANRDAESIIFAGELTDLAARYGDRLEVHHHLDIDDGFVGVNNVTELIAGSRDAEFYICGPGPFMDLVETTLRDVGIDDERIHLERFTAAPPPEPVDEPDSADDAADAPAGTEVTVDVDGRVATVTSRPGLTVIQAARQAGLSPPFSCESGNCATCIGRVVEGSVSMHVNNALTDDEVADGLILTCQAVPTSPTLHVVYGE